MATAAEMVTAIETAMASGAGTAGIVSVSIDGVSTTYDWSKAKDMLLFWERRAQIAAGKRRMCSTIDLRNA